MAEFRLLEKEFGDGLNRRLLAVLTFGSDHQALSRVFADHGEHEQCISVLGLVHKKVVRPSLVRTARTNSSAMLFEQLDSTLKRQTMLETRMDGRFAATVECFEHWLPAPDARRGVLQVHPS